MGLRLSLKLSRKAEEKPYDTGVPSDSVGSDPKRTLRNDTEEPALGF